MVDKIKLEFMLYQRQGPFEVYDAHENVLLEELRKS